MWIMLQGLELIFWMAQMHFFFCMSRHLSAPSHWCTSCTHEAALWGYWDLRTNFQTITEGGSQPDHCSWLHLTIGIMMKFSPGWWGWINVKTHKVKNAVPKVTLCYGKSHLAHTFINGEKEAICLKTQKKKKMQSFQLVGHFCTISACLVRDKPYIRRHTPENFF